MTVQIDIGQTKQGWTIKSSSSLLVTSCCCRWWRW